MPHFPKPWFRKSRDVWYVEIDGRQHNLGPDRKAAFDRYHQLMRRPQREAPISVDSVAAIFDAFLDWTLKHRARATYGWYQERLQRFVDGQAGTPNVGQLRPYHVQQWLDANPGWSDGYKRGCISAMQRAFRWAVKMGFKPTSLGQYKHPPAFGAKDLRVNCR
jgi:hypothetical protein